MGSIFEEDSDEPLIGANIVEFGTSNGTITDYDGTFELKVESLPVQLEVSYIGYENRRIEVTSPDQDLKIPMVFEGGITLAVTEVKGQRISERQRAAPLTVESMDLLAIKETPSDNFYDGLGALKGVDLTAASLGFKIINTRGFNSTSPVRSLQLIDGVDNQSPGLNFSLGNFLGSPELDVLKVDLIAGASSSFYGPNAFNGVINMQTKDPFFHKGLSASIKVGERNMLKTQFRWADAIRNKSGNEFFAYKFNFAHLQADDWEATNYSPIDGSLVPASNPGRFDAVNIYGDEYFNGNDFSSAEPWTYPGLGTWYRTGYEERDLVDYDTRNIKANLVMQFRLQPERKEESMELIFANNYANGTTVYQGDNRFSLKNIQFFQHRLELRKKDRFFIRAYTTYEDAGDSYDPYFTALALLDSAKSNELWASDYVAYWLAEIAPLINESSYPDLMVDFDPETFEVNSSFDFEAAEQWLRDNEELVRGYHDQAENYANTVLRNDEGRPYLSPGTPEFQRTFDEVTGKKRTEGGTLFFDRSQLFHLHGEYQIPTRHVDKFVVGANMRWYRPESEGTVFYDTADVVIRNREFGSYAGFEKSFLDKKLRLNGTLRMDKNQNFDYLFSPAASLVFKPKANHFLRFSFASAIRNPTLSDQYLNLNVGRAILSGNLNGVRDLVTIESMFEYFETLEFDRIERFDIDPVRPEKVKTFELGYRATLLNSLYVDAGYYYSIYNDFLGFNIGSELEIDGVTGLPTGVQVYRYAANSNNQVTTQGFTIGLNYYVGQLNFSGNYNWNRLNKEFEDDPIIPAFNTPEHKFNLGVSGRNITSSGRNQLGFSVNYKWIEGFLFEGSPQFTGFVPTYDLLDVQMNYFIKNLNTTLKLGASNALDNRSIQTYGGPEIGRLAYFSVLYEFKKSID